VKLLGLICVYLIGAIPVGLLVARAVGGVDIRRQGSGNIGATNVLRTLGPAAGALTLIGDVVKGYAAVSLARALDPAAAAWAAAGAVIAIIGNCWPVFLRFRGGKGVATGFGAFLALAPLATAPAALVWVIVTATFRYVSLASMLACIGLPIGVALLGYPGPSVAAAVAAGAIIVGRHHANLSRLFNGTEPRLGERAASSPSA
jgi:acyl phosphate:glycerol-3-phosphate acyltransferase